MSLEKWKDVNLDECVHFVIQCDVNVYKLLCRTHTLWIFSLSMYIYYLGFSFLAETAFMLITHVSCRNLGL